MTTNLTMRCHGRASNDGSTRWPDPGGRNPPPPRTGADDALPTDSPNGPSTKVLSQDQTVCLLRTAYRQASADSTINTGQPKTPSIPSMPSVPSSGGGGGGSPLSSLGGGMGPVQGLMGGGKGLTGPLNNISPAALQGGPAGGAMSPASLGSQFGRGVAAGASAAGAMPPMSAPPPQAPSAPLAAPISPAGGAPVAAAPAGGSTLAAAGNGGGTGTPAASRRRGGWRDASDVVVRVGAASVGYAAGGSRRWWRFGIDRWGACGAVGDWRCW